MNGGSKPVSEARLYEMGATMARETGAHLFVQVVEDGASCMDWHTVSVAAEMLERGERAVWTVLRHEWYHRLVSPRSREHGIVLAMDLNARTGLSLEEAAEVVNIGCDLWVDDAVLAEGGWGGDLYYEELQAELEDVAATMRRARSSPMGEGLAFVVEGMVHVLAERARVHGRPRLIAAPSAVARRILLYFFDTKLGESERLEMLSRDLKALLGDVWELKRLRQELAQMVLMTARLLLASPGALERMALNRVAQGLRDLGVDLGYVSGGLATCRADLRFVRRVRRRMRRLQSYPKLMQMLDLSLRGRHQTNEEGWRSWGLGDPRRKLKPVASFRRYGAIVPGVTTLQAASGRRARPSRGGAGGHVCLVIDDSGSTSGDVNEHEVEMALSVVEAARSFGDAVSLVVFGSLVTATVEWSRDYEMVADRIAGLEGDSGGTSLTPALARAQELVDRAGRATSHVFLLTDTEVHDMREMLPVLERLSRGSRVSIFGFTCEDGLRPFMDRIRGLRGVVAYLSPVGDGFTEASLREVVS